MKAIEAVLLTLHANGEMEAGGSESMPIGRTALQKLVYLASLKTSIDATYYAHYYGPYSEGVAEGISRLWRFGCVHEDVPTSSHPGYAYSLTRDGERLGAEVSDGDMQEAYGEIKRIVHACREFCELRQAQMAYAAKIHYMRTYNNRPDADVDEIIGMGRTAGWSMTAENVRAGLRLLARLGLDK